MGGPHSRPAAPYSPKPCWRGPQLPPTPRPPVCREVSVLGQGVGSGASQSLSPGPLVQGLSRVTTAWPLMYKTTP